jgi:hypothetical protein
MNEIIIDDDAVARGRVRRGHRRRRDAALLLTAAALMFVASCSAKTEDVTTNTTTGPAATSSPGTTKTDVGAETPGTTGKKSGTTSTSSKGGGTTSTTKKKSGTTTSSTKSTSTTLDVDTPPEAEAFCEEAKKVKAQFDDQPSDGDEEQFIRDAAAAFAALTKEAPPEIADDMNAVNEVFQAAKTFEDMTKAFEDDKMKGVTDRIDEYTLANCGFKL